MGPNYTAALTRWYECLMLRDLDASSRKDPHLVGWCLKKMILDLDSGICNELDWQMI